MPPRRGKIVRKEKPKRAPWTVVHRDDVTRFRYPPGPDYPGTSQTQATRLMTTPDHLPNEWVAVEVSWLGTHATPGMTHETLLGLIAGERLITVED